MNDLFCLYCDPPETGKHASGCRLNKEEKANAEAIQDKFEDLAAKFAAASGVPVEEVRQWFGADDIEQKMRETYGEK